MRRSLRRAESSAAKAIPTAHFHATRDEALRLTERNDDTIASKPIFEFGDASGQRFIFKVGDPASVSAEVCAYELQALAGRTCVPARLATLEVEPDVRALGVLKPFLAFCNGSQLSAAPETWTPLQRAAIAREHVWEWFLGNFDTNTSQYALIPTDTGELLPLNVDWDRSFCDKGLQPPTRFDKHKVTLPNAHTFLYADYVEGRIQLHLDLLLREAKRIARLSRADVERAFQRHAAVAFPDDEEQQRRWCQDRLQRQGRIERQFRSFVTELVRERRIAQREQAHWWGVYMWRQGQLLLHNVLRGPLGSFGRSVLRRARGRTLVRASEEPNSHA